MQELALVREDLRVYLEDLLDCRRFADYCPNGLQVEGSQTVRRVALGVTACQALLDAAIAHGADTLIVHHGWFWKSDDRRIIGIQRQRLTKLLAADMNLFAYHLPLDAHAEFGNNAQWASAMGWRIEGRFGEDDLGFIGAPAAPVTLRLLTNQLYAALGRQPLLIDGGQGDKPINRIAWCSGGAQDWFASAIAAGAEVFVSGEISEPQVHWARETGVAYIAAGHHATERFGVKALCAHLGKQFKLDCTFIDIDNPV